MGSNRIYIVLERIHTFVYGQYSIQQAGGIKLDRSF